MKYTLAIIIGIAGVAILGLIQCIMTNNLSDVGRKVHALETSIAEISTENARLSGEIASASSVMAVHEKATALGLTDQKQVISIRDIENVALGILPR